MYKLYPHECVNYVPNSLTFKIIKTNKTLFYFILFLMQNVIKNRTKKLLKNYYLSQVYLFVSFYFWK